MRIVSLRAPGRRARVVTAALIICSLCGATARAAEPARAAPDWSARFDGRVRFYQTTELGAVVVVTERSLYAVDGETGEVLWRRRNVRLDETDVAPVPGTDLLLLSFERDNRTRLEAVDILTGGPLWQSERVRGGVMQMAVDLEAGLLAAVLVRDARSRAREGFKRKPKIHVFDLATGAELWQRDLQSDIEMMPARWSADADEEVPYTLNNYHPPLFLDGRLYLFYEGLTSLEARTGRERQRERFSVNEEGLALTEADAVLDEQHIYASGRGRVRAISRATGREVWEARDLGLTPELVLAGRVLYARTGGQFARLKDGETIERGSYGVSALDVETGRVLWRYRGADKGITNMILPDESTILVADRDDLIALDAATGRRRARISHRVERPAFLLLNERGEAVLGGRNEIAAFDVGSGQNLWRARHNPPGRGVLRTIGAITARAAALYFRYGSAATTAFRGAQLARAAASLRWSGLSGIANAALPNLQALAVNAARERIAARFSFYGRAARLAQTRAIAVPSLPRPSIDSIPRPSIDVEDRLLDRLDPARQLERLSRFLWRRRQLAALRGQWMYFYTDLRGDAGRGLAGVNINTGRAERAISLSDPDERFVVDEAAGLLYSANGDRLRAFLVTVR